MLIYSIIELFFTINIVKKCIKRYLFMQGTVTKLFLGRLLSVSQLQNMVSQPTRKKEK